MSNLVNRIISASAGTGKTYRLSLEYLALLLKFYDKAEFRPDQILVITFTRKATAEIRERIYLHLDTLSNRKAGWQDLARNLKKLMGAQNDKIPVPSFDGRDPQAGMTDALTGEDKDWIPAFAGMTKSLDGMTDSLKGADVDKIPVPSFDGRDPQAGKTDTLTGVTDLANPLTETEQRMLSQAYHHLITHKDELQVMTIDSYIHSIFRNLIRPVRGIDRFELDLKAVDKRMPFLFNELMTPSMLKRVESLLSRRLKPSLAEFKSFFRSLIDNRWLYYLASKRSVEAAPNTLAFYSLHPELWQVKAHAYYLGFTYIFRQIILNFNEYLQVKQNKTLSSEVMEANLLNKEFALLFSPLPHKFSELADNLDAAFADERVLLRLLKLLKDDKYIWNGQKVRSSKENPMLNDWKELHRMALAELSNYLIFHLFLPEQREILDIWQEVLNHYDKLIYRYKDFTYDDIAWFTFEGLYSSEPPLFEAEKESVANEFYEFMCHRTRFMLIDEFQDTSILQFQILAPMIEELISGEGSKPYGGLIVVGDEKQSIFGWRGGQRDLLLNLDNIFPGMQTYDKDSLTDSWRSSPTLMNFINGIFGNPELHAFLDTMQAEWSYPEITGQKKALDAETVINFKLQHYASRSADNKLDKAMRSFVEEMIIPALPVGAEHGRSIAILARKNDELEMIRTLLAEHGITSEYQSSRSLLDQPFIKAMIFLLRFAVYNDWYDFLAFLRSDLVLMDGKTLKQVINIISAYQQDNRHSCLRVPPVEGRDRNPGSFNINIISAYQQDKSDNKQDNLENNKEECHSCEGRNLKGSPSSEEQQPRHSCLRVPPVEGRDRNPGSFDTNKSEINFHTIPLAKAALALAGSLDKNRIYQSCLMLIQTCQIQNKLPLERDFVNIQRWLDIALDYEQNYQSELPELQGFLRYCEDNREQEIFQQQDVVNSSAIQLLTIHKSKGLEFDSVFVWWNLKGFSGREDSKLSSYVHYTDKSYHNLKDIALSLHYDKVLETSAFNEIILADKIREQVEELNNLYVALTRAKSRLYLHVAFDKKEGWDKYWSEYQDKSKLTPQHYAVKAALDYLNNHSNSQENGFLQIGIATVTESPLPSKPEQFTSALSRDVIDLKAILPDWQKPLELLPREDVNAEMNWKTSYLVDRDNLKGLIAHYYLAQIKYATKEKIALARILTLRQFGNLMTLSSLNELIDKVEAHLPDLKELFNPDYDIIYTEYPIFHKGKEYRIDRLMLNTVSKTYRLIDYKTGKTYTPDQLTIYASILRNSILPKDYKQEKEPDFIEISL